MQPQMQKKAAKNSQNQTAMAMNKTNRIGTTGTPTSAPLLTCVFQGMAGQKNDVGCGEENKKGLDSVNRPRPSGSFFRPGLAIPRRVARQQSPTPFHQAHSL
jgi:hypothetical protein